MVPRANSNTLKPVTVAVLVSAIRNGKWQRQVSAVRKRYNDTFRQTQDHDAAKRACAPLKKKLPAVMWSGTFKGRGDDQLDESSGLLCADLDHLDDQTRTAVLQKAKTDPHVGVGFTSPTGTGVKLVFAVAGNAEQHHASFAAVKAHVEEHYGLPVDESCKNLERLCFVSSDSAAFWNNQPEPLAPLVESELPANNQAQPHSSASCILNNCVPASLDNCIPASLHHNAETILANITTKISAQKAFEAKRPALAKLYAGLIESRFQAQEHARNHFLTEAVPFLYRAVAAPFVLELVGHFYDCNRSLFHDPREQHLKEANAMLEAVTESYVESLSTDERKIYAALNEHEQDAFRICRDLALLPEPEREPFTFFLSFSHLADRLGFHPMQAQRILRQLEIYGLIRLLQKGTRRAQGVKGEAGTYRWQLPPPQREGRRPTP